MYQKYLIECGIYVIQIAVIFHVRLTLARPLELQIITSYFECSS